MSYEQMLGLGDKAEAMEDPSLVVLVCHCLTRIEPLAYK